VIAVTSALAIDLGFDRTRKTETSTVAGIADYP
jgi:hypothetical protein